MDLCKLLGSPHQPRHTVFGVERRATADAARADDGVFVRRVVLLPWSLWCCCCCFETAGVESWYCLVGTCLVCTLDPKGFASQSFHLVLKVLDLAVAQVRDCTIYQVVNILVNSQRLQSPHRLFLLLLPHILRSTTANCSLACAGHWQGAWGFPPTQHITSAVPQAPPLQRKSQRRRRKETPKSHSNSSSNNGRSRAATAATTAAALSYHPGTAPGTPAALELL